MPLGLAEASLRVSLKNIAPVFRLRGGAIFSLERGSKSLNRLVHPPVPAKAGTRTSAEKLDARCRGHEQSSFQLPWIERQTRPAP
jgi:hypothetical protein